MATRLRRPYTQTRNFIQIEGEAVKLITETTSRVIKLTDFLNSAGGYSGVSTPILPTGCKLFKQKQSRSIFVIEQAPKVRTVTWTGMNPDLKKVSWRLAFPYVVFIIEFIESAVSTNSMVFYRNNPISSLQDTLYHTNLCNVFNTDKICTGSARITGESLSEKADSFANIFWLSQFNADLNSHQFLVDARSKPEVVSLEAWQDATRENSLFPMTLTWREADKLDSRVNQLLDI